MSLISADSDPTLAAHDCLSVLNAAVGRRVPASANRVLAAADARSPDEGLALLGAYISIADRRVRQAILDTVRAIAAVDEEIETPVA